MAKQVAKAEGAQDVLVFVSLVFRRGPFSRNRYYLYTHDQRISGLKMFWRGRQRKENDEEERELRLVGIYSVRLPLTMVECVYTAGYR